MSSSGKWRWYKIIANRKMGDESVYNKWWKQPDKYKVFGVLIHEIEEAMNIHHNKPFDQSEEKFSRLEELLNMTLNVFYDDNSKDGNKHFTCSQIYSGYMSTSLLSLCILNDTRFMVAGNSDTIHKHFIYIKDLTGFKQHIYLQNDVKNRNLSRSKKCRFCDFSGSQTAVQNHEVQIHRDQIDECDKYELESQQIHLQFTNQRFEIPALVVAYTNFESAINEKNRCKPIMLSCLAVFHIPTIYTQLQVFHTPHEEESDLRPFMDYLIQLQESVKRHLFNEISLEMSPKVKKDY